MEYVIVPVIAVVCGVVCLSSWRKKWTIDDTPTSTCRGVFVGRNEVVGQAVPLYQPLTTPFTQAQAVWFSWQLEKYTGGKNDEWTTLETRATAAPFWIQDDTGRVLVRPRAAEIDTGRSLVERVDGDFAPPYNRWQLRQWVLVGEDVIERQQSMSDGSFAEPPQQPMGWFSTTGDTATPLHSLSGKHRVTERSICVGDQLYLLGTARPRHDGSGLEFAGGEEDLLVSTKSEAQVASSSKWVARGAGIGCLGASALFVGMVSDAVLNRIAWGAVIGIVVAELALLFVIALMRNYNRQVEVKEQAAKAWSLIDVSLRRRADLVPQLVEVVKGYAAHERSVQEAAAQVRTQVQLPEQQTLPSESNMVVAETSDRELRASSATTVALAEAYPDLKAGEVFLDLQRRITDAEESVASARLFYNQAIEVLRNRRQQFPGSLFARMVEVPSWRLFEAEEAAAALPEVSLAPEEAPSVDPASAPPTVEVPPPDNLPPLEPPPGGPPPPGPHPT